MHHATYLALSFLSAVNHLVQGMGTLASIREVGRQCLVRGAVWRCQNSDAKEHTKTYLRPTCRLFLRWGFEQSGYQQLCLGRRTHEGRQDHHATYLALSFPSAVNHLVQGTGAVASIREVGRQCLVRGIVW